MARTLLLTRPYFQAKEFARKVEQQTNFNCHICPMQEIRAIDAELDLSQTDGLVFTSRHGVQSFAHRSDIRDIPAYCVGPATANAARDAGFTAYSARGNAQSLAALLAEAGHKNYVHLHGVHKTAGPDLATQNVAIYDQVSVAMDAQTKVLLATGRMDAVALFSPRSAQLLVDIWRDTWPIPQFFCLSDAVAKPVKHLGRTLVSQKPNAASLIALLQE